MSQKPAIAFLEHAGFDAEALSLLQTSYDVHMCDIDDPASLDAAGDAAGLFVRLKSKIDKDVLDQFPSLRFVMSPTTGHNHLDLTEFARRGIQVVSLKGESDFLNSITATAELTWGLILSMTRHIPAAIAHVADSGWDRDQFRGLDLSGRILGIVGYGRLGRIIETYAHAFRMRILVHDIEPRDPEFGQLVDFETLLEQSDIVTMHVDVNPSNLNLFDEAAFRRMKPTAFFINTSRGELVDEASLVLALKENRLAAAATDVIRDEQTDRQKSPLLQARTDLGARLLITPHIGGASLDSMAKTEHFIVLKLLNAEIQRG
jgi:D-3-phosphoglycerate dehydrogenase / 2-oxoglutarate reductase